MQVPWIQVSKSSSLLLMVKPAVFLVAVGMGSYVLPNYFALYIKTLGLSYAYCSDWTYFTCSVQLACVIIISELD